MCLRESPPPFSPGVIGMNTLVASDDLLAGEELGEESPGDDLAGALRVGVGGVEERDPALDGRAHDRLGGLLVEHPRFVAVVAEAHHAQAHARDPQAARAEVHVLHLPASGLD